MKLNVYQHYWCWITHLILPCPRSRKVADRDVHWFTFNFGKISEIYSKRVKQFDKWQVDPRHVVLSFTISKEEWDESNNPLHKSPFCHVTEGSTGVIILFQNGSFSFRVWVWCRGRVVHGLTPCSEIDGSSSTALFLQVRNRTIALSCIKPEACEDEWSVAVDLPDIFLLYSHMASLFN